MKKTKLSVVLATRNEEINIKRCLTSVKNIADEIIVCDEYSTDNTRQIAKQMGARVFLEEHHQNFHLTKQKALAKATCEWILQLDADEVVTEKLSKEILEVINMTNDKLFEQREKILSDNSLFRRHEIEIQKRDGKIGQKNGLIVAFFIPRLNMFLGKPLRHAGVYPDPAIRLIKNGKGFFPAKSVHEIMEIQGEVSWLKNSMEHFDSPTFSRYLSRANRYTDFTAMKFNQNKIKKNVLNLIYYSFIKPLMIFIELFLIHSGFKDGVAGFVWSIFSAMHFPIAYYKYWSEQ